VAEKMKGSSVLLNSMYGLHEMRRVDERIAASSRAFLTCATASFLQVRRIVSEYDVVEGDIPRVTYFARYVKLLNFVVSL
jgi:hypothetical protein